jgi:hypothetical protein
MMKTPLFDRSFFSWLKQVWSAVRKQPPRFQSRRVNGVPNALEPNTLYVIGDDECAWAGALLCPCGCRDVIRLSLVTDASPSWTVKVSRDGSVSLNPSVRKTTGCRSHFILYRSRVLWCRPDYVSETRPTKFYRQ